MSMRFIYGRSGSGKTSYIINDIKKHYNNKKSDNQRVLLVIVPEQLTFQTEKKFIKEFGFLGIDIEVTSFKRLAYRIFKEVGGITKTYIQPAGKSMLLYKIIEDLKDELKVFTKPAKQIGFVNNILEIISEFKRYNVTVEELNEMKLGMSDNDFLYNKLSDIILIYEKFNLILSSGYLDPEDDLTIVARRIKESKVFKNIDIWIDEFSGFTPQQYVILEELIHNGCNLNISLNMDYKDEDSINYREVFSPIIYTKDKLIDIALKNNIQLMETIKLSSNPVIKFKDSDDLAYIEGNYFSYPFKPFNGEINNIEIFKAMNIYSEVENLACNILSLCRDSKAKFSEIAVITRNLDAYESLVKSIFNEYKISYFIDDKKDISSNKVIVLISSLMEILNNNWRYESIFRYLKTGILNLDFNNIDILENYVLSSGIKGKKAWTDDYVWYKNIIMNYGLKYKFKSYIDKDMNDDHIEDYIINLLINGENLYDVIDENDEKLIKTLREIKLISNTRNQFIEPIISMGNSLRGKRTVRDFCVALFNYLDKINIVEKLELWIKQFNENQEIELINEYSKIWNFLMELLDQMVEVIGEDKITLDKFAKIMQLGFKDHKMGFIPQALEEVIVSSVERFRGHNIKYLFILGVNDGVFPKSIDKEGILTDRDRMFLKDRGIELAKDSRSTAFEEQYLIYTTLTLGSKFLRVSYPIADHEGKALRPSIIISRLKALLPNLIEESNVINNDEETLISRTVPTFNNLISSFQELCVSKGITPFWGETYRWFYENEYWREKIDEILEAFSYCNEVKSIGKNKALKLYGDDRKLSVSRVESYIRCPFGYFIKYGLKAEERKIFSLNPPDLGSFIHSVLDRFSRIVDKESSFSEIEETLCYELIERSFNMEMEESTGNVFKASSKFSYFGQRIKNILHKAAKLIVKHMQSGNFSPLGYEIEFGFNNQGYSPIELTLSNGDNVQLVGKIDRVDKLIYEGEEYFRVIDYKSGNKDFKLWEVYYGLQIQLLTYLDAILEKEEELINFPVLPAGILYFKIDNPMVKASSNLSDEEIEKEIMKALKMKGLILADTKIVREMDKEMEGVSLILPVGFKKDGDFTSSSNVATREQFELLRTHIRHKLVEACESIFEGVIDINPCKTSMGDACEYCEYSSICVFDCSMRNNEYRFLAEKKDSEVWQIISKEQEDRNNE